MIQRIGCLEIPVSDMGRAQAFYENVLGLKKTYEHPVWTSFAVGRASFALAVSGTKGSPKDTEICKSCSPCTFRYSVAGTERERPNHVPSCVIYLAVGDLEAIHVELKNKGVAFISEPRTQAWGGKTAVMLDPDRNTLVLAQYA